MAGKIFINYRRGDDAGFTQALYLRLEDEFAAADLFMDVEGHIKPGDDFVEVLNAQVAASDVLLVVIGPRWAELLDARQDDPDDFVAIEIKAALDQGKRVIPVLVGGASVPRADTLPEVIRPLARRNAVGLRPERFKTDCQGLVAALKESLAAAQQERAARTESERRAAEAARLEAEAQAAARVRATEERGRAQAAAGLSADEIRKAEELANWDFVKDRNDLQYLRDHLARFPGGTTERYVLTKLDGLVWAGLGSAATVQQLRSYVDEFPKGANAAAAQSRIAALEREAADTRAAEQRRAQETEEWGGVAASANVSTIQAFMARWPGGQHAKAAHARIAELKRGSGAEKRAMLYGVAATVLVVLIGAGGWWGYEQWRVRESLKDASLKVLERSALQAMKPGDTFKECKTCPEMVLVPAAGSFEVVREPTFGYTATGERTDLSPGASRTITILQPFAVGKLEVKFEEWNACADAGACGRYKPDQMSRYGSTPVDNVSWHDATNYAKWLSAKTGETYRLPTEAEWEYAARWSVRNISKWEWVQDCYGKYAEAPRDGSAASEIFNCGRVVRNGRWNGRTYPYDAGLYRDSADRDRSDPNARHHDVSFRVVRILNSVRN